MVNFLKNTGQSSFILPDDPETDAVDMDDIIQVLPETTVITGTARSSAKQKFAVDLGHIHG